MYWQKRAKPSKRGFSQAWAHRLLTCSDWARRRLFKVKLSESPPSSACLVDGNAASISAKKGAGGSRASPWPSPPWNCWRRWFITHLVGPSQFIAGRWQGAVTCCKWLILSPRRALKLAACIGRMPLNHLALGIFGPFSVRVSHSRPRGTRLVNAGLKEHSPILASHFRVRDERAKVQDKTFAIANGGSL
jgi:hypothetical protein